MDSDTAVSDPPPDVLLPSDPLNPLNRLTFERPISLGFGGLPSGKHPKTRERMGRVPGRAGKPPGPNAATLSAVKIRHEIMRVFAGDLPLAHASPRVRRYMQVLDSVGRKAIKGKALREFREMNAEVFKLLPREDTLIHRAETIMVGPGADEAADEALAEGE
jgi:hypothetical protein